MIETGRAVSRHHFRSLLAPGEMTRLEASLGYVQRRSQGLVMADDYHVRYFTGRLHGTRVAWVVHSAIEHVFAPRSFSFPEGVTP